jgi:hypothetical protein
MKISFGLKVMTFVLASFLAALLWFMSPVLPRVWLGWPRPPGVSKSAHYTVRVEVGRWFDCSLDATQDVNVCSAWDDDGRLLANGRYRLKGQNRAATKAELVPSDVNVYAGRPDLSWIYLYGRRGNFSLTLIPVDSVDSDRSPMETPGAFRLP